MDPLKHPVARAFFGAIAGMTLSVMSHAWVGRGSYDYSAERALIASPDRPYLWLAVGGAMAGALFGLLLPRARTPWRALTVGLICAQPAFLGAWPALHLTFPALSRTVAWVLVSLASAVGMALLSATMVDWFDEEEVLPPMV